mmetsp:Transcript_6769/g.16603  ORF Transcript_6769/g.16603 Transcript_6769/m.16603 type:complete len:408 (+) Transcript_6769:141-1364(+)
MSTKLSVKTLSLGYQSQSDFNSDLDLDPTQSETEASRNLKIEILIQASLWCNVVLFVVKLYASIMSHSLAVIGSTIDSFLDLLTQLVIFGVHKCSQLRDRSKYPAGVSRLEPIGVILCASIMGMAAMELVWHSILQLIRGKHKLYFTALSTSILVAAVFIKLVLYVFCSRMSRFSPSLFTLAEDHRNDVLTNTMALATGLIAHQFLGMWWMDPTGAILMSAYIAFSWFFIAKEHVEMLVGKSAPPELIAKLKAIAEGYHSQMKLDIIRVYHFGTRFLVELEMVLPEDKTVKWAHDRSLKLQKLLEQQEDVERAYVHCDWKSRDEDEHDWEYIRQKFQEKVMQLRQSYHSYQEAYQEEEASLRFEVEAKENARRRHKRNGKAVGVEAETQTTPKVVYPDTALSFDAKI